MNRVNPLASLGLVLAAAGCNSFDEPSEVGPNDPVLVIPTDERVAVQPDRPPPPVSGGTLAVSQDGALAVAADPDRDRVVLVDLNQAAVKQVISLDAGDEPGRVVMDSSGRAFVGLRKGGAVAVINLETSELTGRLELCSEPRGLALEGELLHVACAGGELVTVPTSGGAPTRTLDLGPDLRDVVVVADGLMVSRFRSAQILHVDAGGAVTSTTLANVKASALQEVQHGNVVEREIVERDLTPSVAWRMVSNGQGRVVILHQRGLDGELALSAPSNENTSSYGGDQGGCGAIVQAAITEIDENGAQKTTKPIASLALGVDVAVAPTTGRLAVANAGLADPNAPEPKTLFLGDGDVALADAGGATRGSLRVLGPGTLQFAANDSFSPEDCAHGETSVEPAQPVTSVAWTSGEVLVAQTREPSQLILIGEAPAGNRTVIDLGGASVLDTGHEIFHRDSGGGLACASCHPEGREDGRVWQFEGVGMRRTQPLDVGLEGTQPFHWSGDLPGLSSLMDEVFVTRMGGVLQGSGRLAALERWLFARQPLTPLRRADDPAVERGRLLFRSAEVGCATCHQGEKLTHTSSFRVREASEAFQVPSLIGVGHRAPFMHDGCAATLAARFDPTCGGGELHGNTAQLSEAEVSDLVSYLQSL